MKNLLYWLSRKVNYPFIPPKVVQISLTYRCNLKCKMCSLANLLPKDQELSTTQILHIVREARKYGAEEILLTGGEPFLREDLFEIANFCHSKGLRSIITTNGTLIDGRIAELIINSRMDHIHFSVDGMGRTNDHFRGQGTFDKIVESVKLLDALRQKGNSFSLGFACTVMDGNIKELYELVKLADNLNVDSINFQPLVNDNSNFIHKQLSPFWVKRENIELLKSELSKIKKYSPKHITIYEEPRLELLVDYYNGTLKKGDWKCFGGFKTVFICFEKNRPLVYSCHGICGNLDEVSLKDAWHSKEAYKLRIHSSECKDLCLQSCYSLEESSSLINSVKEILRKLAKL